MEGNAFDLALTALTIMLDPGRLMALAAGVLVGLMIGVIPGLGGVVGMALLIPFTYDMDPYAAFGFLIGMGSVTTTSDTVPAVLFGVPGTVGAAATIMDGYPLAQQGQAGRAFGAAYTASLLGGLAGAVLLAISIPVLRPIILYLQSPDLLAICVFALSMVATLSGRAPLKGMTAAGLGLLVAMVGSDPQSGTLRWTFGSLYLWDGVPLVPLTLGLFAIPELADMAVARRSIATGAKIDTRHGQLAGVRDALGNWWLILRCSWLGAALGAVPGLGSAVIDWIAYGHAIRTCRNTERFGQGDIRGVIAPESAANAKEGGALVPTLAFGVPGSASMAILLGAFTVHGLIPGPRLLTEHLDITYSIVWSIALANVLGAGLCIAFSNQLARVASVRIGTLLPLVLAIMFMGAFQGSRQWGDLYVLLGFGALGWVMKRLGWPRAPLILGFVLGGIIERYLFISIGRYEWEWLTQPLVMAFFALAVFTLAGPLLRSLRASSGRVSWMFSAPRFSSAMWFPLSVIVLLVAAIVAASGWPFAARIVPQVVAATALVCIASSVAFELFTRGALAGTAAADRRGAAGAELDLREQLRRSGEFFLWCCGYVVLALALGLLPALLAFVALSMRFWGREPVMRSLLVALCMGGFCWVLFDRLLAVPWPASLIGSWFPALAAYLP
jgi:putative tricarboxylic transport membrane protein